METTEKTALSILSEISRISNSYIDLSEKLRRIVEVVARGMGKDGTSVFLIDRSGKNVTLSAAIGLNQESIGKLSFPLGMGIAGWVAEQKVPLALEDPYSDPRFLYLPESGIGHFKSLVAAPIMDQDACLGVIFVLSSSVWSATSADITLLTTTANQLSGVIKSARLFQSLQDRLSELSTIYEIGMALTSTLDLEQLLSLIARNSAQSLRAQGCTIRLMNLPEIEQDKTFALYSLVGDIIKDMDARLGSLVVDKVVQEKRALLIQDVTKEPVFRDDPGIAAGSIIGAPLIFHDKLIGVITLYNKQEGQQFTEDDLQFLTTVASGAAVAVENALCTSAWRTSRMKREKRAQELSMLYDMAQHEHDPEPRSPSQDHPDCGHDGRQRSRLQSGHPSHDERAYEYAPGYDGRRPDELGRGGPGLERGLEQAPEPHRMDPDWRALRAPGLCAQYPCTKHQGAP
jgi:signal transduction protein with GAF and PtsI domain